MSDAVGSGRDDALRTRMMRYTVAAMFFVGFAGKGVRGIFGDIGSLVPRRVSSLPGAPCRVCGPSPLRRARNSRSYPSP